MSITTRIIDTDAYEVNAEAIATDRSDFESFVFAVENALNPSAET